MADIAARYHTGLQHNGQRPNQEPDRAEIGEILNNMRAKLSAESKKKLSEAMDEERVREAIRETNREKAPGLDGIPIELWKSLDDQFLASEKEGVTNPKCNIVRLLTRVFNDIEQNGMEEVANFNEGCMTPIYKKKDPNSIENYRPITLLNTDLH